MGKKTYYTDLQLKPSNLLLGKAAKANPEKKANEVLKKYPFLKPKKKAGSDGSEGPSEDQLEVKEDWSKRQLRDTTAYASEIMRCKTLVAADYVLQDTPTYTEKDFLIVNRNGVAEVWTLRLPRSR